MAGVTRLAVSGDGLQVAWHLLGLLAVLAWTTVTSLLVMLPLLICGKLRISEAAELEGVDVGKVEEQSYTKEEGEEVGCQGYERHIQDIKISAQSAESAVEEEEGEEQEMAILSASFPAPTPPPSPPPSPSPAPPPSPPTTSFPTEGFVEELRNTLKMQREQLREKTEELRPVEVAGEQGVEFGEEEEEGSDTASVTSETAMQAALTAANRENFNYFQGHRPLQEVEREVVTVLRTTTTRSNNIVRVLEPVEKEVSFAGGDRDGTFVKDDDGEAVQGDDAIIDVGLSDQVKPSLKVGFREEGEGDG